MPSPPTYGSVFVYGASESPDKNRLSGPSTSPPVGDDPWYGPYGIPVDKWSNATHPGYPVGDPYGDPAWVPNVSWLYGVSLPDGVYSRVIQPRRFRFDLLKTE